jgi:hypothetical protein
LWLLFTITPQSYAAEPQASLFQTSRFARANFWTALHATAVLNRQALAAGYHIIVWVQLALKVPLIMEMLPRALSSGELPEQVALVCLPL